MPFSPFLAHTTHYLIYRHSVNGFVLKFARRGVRGLCQHEYSLVVFAAYVQQRLYAVRAEIAVYGLIDALCDIVPAVKPQAAYYEMYGPAGMKALYKTQEYSFPYLQYP